MITADLNTDTIDPNWKRRLVEAGGSCDSDRSCACPACGSEFDGEIHTWEAGEEECPDCGHLFMVQAE